MKKLFAVMAIAVLAVACNNKKEENKTETTDTTKMENIGPDTTNMMAPDTTTQMDTTTHM